MRIAAAEASFQRAAQDLRRTGFLLAFPANIEGALSHRQQSVGKALKGFLTWHDFGFRKVHDLDEMGKRYSAVDSSPAGVVDCARFLVAFVSRFRCACDSYQPEFEEPTAALGLAREVLDTILTPPPPGSARESDNRPSLL